MNKKLAQNKDIGAISTISDELNNTIDKKLKAVNADAGKAHTMASALEKKKNYYEVLLAKDGIFDKLWRSIYGTDQFTNGLRKLLIRISHDTLLAKARREDISSQISEQEAKDLPNLTQEKGFFNKAIIDTPLKNLYKELHSYLNKPNPTDDDWRSIDIAKQQYDWEQPKDKKSPELENLINELNENHQQIMGIGKRLNTIQNKVTPAIQSYLEKYDLGRETDARHIPKVIVMKAIRAYVTSPSQENWTKLEESTKPGANVGWDKGLFSNVRFMMSEAKKVHEEQKQFEADLSQTPRPG